MSFVTSVRLSNGNVPSQGRVEVLWAGQWGTVLQFGPKEASVICRQLGYSGGHAVGPQLFGKGCGQIWLSRLDCQGNETTLAACPHGPLGVNGGSHDQDGGVFCSKYIVKNF